MKIIYLSIVCLKIGVRDPGEYEAHGSKLCLRMKDNSESQERKDFLRRFIHDGSAKTVVKYVLMAIDAFTDSAFKGNPEALLLLDEERDEEWLQAVACEFNLSETCYLTRLSEPAQSTIGSVPRFGLRWFTPVAEVKLCGYATLAASHFLFLHDLVKPNTVEFTTLSEILNAKRLPNYSNGNASDNFIIELGFPVDTVMEYNGAADVSTVSKSLNGASDPVTGSANCALAAYLGKKLGKCDLIAYQASLRSGVLDLHHDMKNQRVLLRGKAVAVMEGSLLSLLAKLLEGRTLHREIHIYTSHELSLRPREAEVVASRTNPSRYDRRAKG
ncbi:uncharacterized isomerase bh0283 [Phtheirospermum japonicum]|uniref:Uncharacterized isomerase bh0283 n=1 Tax=Phtheirospermum japonicum TaxID=374723 RepID=A0A830BTU7_9LAMI|nr:uncharacterized isomerase bh0283 [Phtheirospermum japonicum]